MKNDNHLRAWVLVFGILAIMTLAALGVIAVIRSSTQRMLQPVTDLSSDVGTQVAQVLHPTPTIIPDPVTIIYQVRTLARLETIQYSVEKVITAETGQGVFGPLIGDRLLFVAHGYVIAGIDLEKLGPADMWVEDGVLYVQLPDAEIFVATLDNEKSYVYDRETGIFSQGSMELETLARQAAEDEIRQAALDDGILDLAQTNAETYIYRLLRSLGYAEVIFIEPETE
jgi:hypothetical protein